MRDKRAFSELFVMETRMFRRVASSELSDLSPQRICVIKPSALGDVVQTLPLLPVLRASYPEAQITWVINRELRGLVDGNPYLHEVIPFERRGGWAAWRELLQSLWSRRFDVVFDLQGLLRSGAMTVATRAPIRVGLQTAREGSRFTTNCTIPDSGRDMPAHARYWRIAEVLGRGMMPRQTHIATSNEDRGWADEIVSQLPHPIVAVHPGARWETKRWPVEKFAALLSLSAAEWNGTALLLGSPSESPDAARLNQQLHEQSPNAKVINLAGKSSLKQLSALLARVDLAISNDSGPMHLAAALGIPTLGLFTCTSATRSGPPGEQHELVSTTVSCAASYCKLCPHTGDAHLACLRELDVARVWHALQQLIAKNQIDGTSHSKAA